MKMDQDNSSIIRFKSKSNGWVQVCSVDIGSNWAGWDSTPYKPNSFTN